MIGGEKMSNNMDKVKALISLIVFIYIFVSLLLRFFSGDLTNMYFISIIVYLILLYIMWKY